MEEINSLNGFNASCGYMWGGVRGVYAYSRVHFCCLSKMRSQRPSESLLTKEQNKVSFSTLKGLC